MNGHDGPAGRRAARDRAARAWGAVPGPTATWPGPGSPLPGAVLGPVPDPPPGPGCQATVVLGHADPTVVLSRTRGVLAGRGAETSKVRGEGRPRVAVTFGLDAERATDAAFEVCALVADVVDALHASDDDVLEIRVVRVSGRSARPV